MIGPDTFKPVQFGRFLLTERLAVGGMAEIFTAKLLGAMGFEKRLVVKRILPAYAADRGFVRMLATEAKLVCNLEHPNIVQVYELGEVDGRYYIAMEHVDGIDLRSLWRALARQDLRLPIPLALYVTSEFLKGLDYAHNAVGPDGEPLGVVHRDVSPSNILVSYRGDVKIGDFGIALVQQESKSRISSVRGKFGYMTPEQLSGATVDHRSDVFAAGVVLAELLTGRRLFKGKSQYETMRRVIDVDLQILEEHEPDLPAPVVDVVRHALARDVDARYQSAAAFQEQLAAQLRENAPRVGGKSLAAFLAEHVLPLLSPGDIESQDGQATASGVLPPETVTRSITAGDELGQELTPSGSGDPWADEDPTIPGEPPDSAFISSGETFTPSSSFTPSADTFTEEEPTGSTQVVDWSRLAPELANVDGSVDEQPPADGGGLAGHMRSQLERDFAVLAHEGDQDPEEIRHHGEMEFDFADATDVPLKTRDEVLQEMEASLDQPRPPVPKAEPGPSDLEGLTVSVQLTAADAADRKPEFSGTLVTNSPTRVLFRLCAAAESGVLVVTGPGTTGRQAELQGWIARLQDQLGSSTDRPALGRRTCQILLAEGHPTMISADRSEEALAAYIVRVGVVTGERLRDAMAAHRELGPVAALVAAGELSPLQLSRQLSSFVQWSVLGTFAWSGGSYAFHRSVACDEGFPATYRGLELIGKGVSYLELPALDARLDRVAGRKLRRIPGAPDLDDLAPTLPLGPVLRALASPRTTARVMESCPTVDARKIKQALYLLLECELVRPA